MTRRLVLAAAVAALLGGAAAPALAGPQPEHRHVVCVLGPTSANPSQEGYCVSWDD